MRLLVSTVAAVIISFGPAMAQNKGKSGIEASNWGQDVKAANQAENGYPNGTSRGGYVSGQARDSDGPGYGREIHGLANPGKSDPKGQSASRR